MHAVQDVVNWDDKEGKWVGAGYVARLGKKCVVRLEIWAHT